MLQQVPVRRESMSYAEVLAETGSWPKNALKNMMDLFPHDIRLDEFFTNSFDGLLNGSLCDIDKRQCCRIHPHDIRTQLVFDVEGEYGPDQRVDVAKHLTRARRYNLRPFSSEAELWTFFVNFLKSVMEHEGTTFYMPFGVEEVQVGSLRVDLYTGLDLKLLEPTDVLDVSFAHGQGGQLIASTFVLVKRV